MSGGLRVGIVGCGLIGRKRGAALRPADRLVGAYDSALGAAEHLADTHGARACESLDALLRLEPEVVVVATAHDGLMPAAVEALQAGAHVLIEKPGGLGSTQIECLEERAEACGRRVKVGFNHRFHPGLSRLAQEVHSGRYGELLHLRARYGHGGRPGYDREWRADPARSGGGELIDQGMHLLDLSHWIAGPLPLCCALLRTSFWDMPVEDNAALILGERESRTQPWSMLHVSWTEWKNTFSIEVYCRTAKLQVDGLVRSYGPQVLRIFRMDESLGPPAMEEHVYEDVDHSWDAEWAHFAERLEDGGPFLGGLADARYAWSCVEAAYADAPAYREMRAGVGR